MAKERKCNHPDFKYVLPDGATPLVFIFERRPWKTLTAEQMRDYERRKKIVEANGGHMPNARGEENPPFSHDDVRDAVQAVLDANPDLIMVQTWNGAGYYALSVGCRKK